MKIDAEYPSPAHPAADAPRAALGQDPRPEHSTHRAASPAAGLTGVGQLRTAMHLRWYGPALLILGLVALALVAIYQASVPTGAAVVRVDAAPYRLPADLAQVDFADAQWRTLALPATACAIRCDTPYRVYRHRFDGAELPPDAALWLPFFDTNVAVYLNGNRLFQLGSMIQPVDVHRYQPQLLRLPSDRVRDGPNTLVLLLAEERRGVGGLTPFYLSDYAALAKAQFWRSMLVQYLPNGMFWLQLASLVLACTLLWRNQRQSPLRWFVLIVPAWLWITLPDGARSVVPVALRIPVLQACFFIALGLTPLFVMSLLREPPRWLIRVLLGFTLGSVAVIVVCQRIPSLTHYWQIMIPQYLLKYSAFLLIPLTLWQIARYGRAQKHRGLSQGVFACALLPGLFGLTDALLSASGPREFTLLPLAGGALAIALWLELANRFSANQQSVRNFTSELQSRLHEKEQTLKQNFESLRESDRERTLLAERQRLLRDMHDGVAGHMTALIHLAGDPNAQREQLVNGLREGLTDLRIVLDSLNHGDDDLLDALGSFRQRIEPVLASAGIRLVWQVDPHLLTHGWGPEAVLQVYRMLQETVSNTIKHAAATELCIALNSSADGLLLKVQDNGRGFEHSPERPSQGFGLLNLHQRAAQLGAKLRISSGADGTSMYLDLPAIPGQARTHLLDSDVADQQLDQTRRPARGRRSA